jgi:hypothetical protein
MQYINLNKFVEFLKKKENIKFRIHKIIYFSLNYVFFAQKSLSDNSIVYYRLHLIETIISILYVF